MSLSPSSLPCRRSALRRAVDLECNVRAELWDGALPHRARDLSPHGLWLDTDLPLEVGEEVLVSFRPPRGSGLEWPVITRGAITRVGMHRRRVDTRPAGMGVAFLDLDDHDRRRLARALIGIPPPIPQLPLPRPLREDELPMDCLRLPDGSLATLRAEAPLLTSRRATMAYTRRLSLVPPPRDDRPRGDGRSGPHLRLVTG